MRRFPDMPARRDALRSFYSGPVWAKHRVAANTYPHLPIREDASVVVAILDGGSAKDHAALAGLPPPRILRPAALSDPTCAGPTPSAAG